MATARRAKITRVVLTLGKKEANALYTLLSEGVDSVSLADAGLKSVESALLNADCESVGDHAWTNTAELEAVED